jgi:hypothetical protein
MKGAKGDVVVGALELSIRIKFESEDATEVDRLCSIHLLEIDVDCTDFLFFRGS